MEARLGRPTHKFDIWALRRPRRATLFAKLCVCEFPILVGIRMIRVKFNRPVIVFNSTAVLAKFCERYPLLL